MSALDTAPRGRSSPSSTPKPTLSVEEKRRVEEDMALYFISIGWLVQKDDRGITISQPEELIRHQNVSGSRN